MRGPPLNFLKYCNNKYGDTFTLHLGGKYMTFLFNEEDYQLIFTKNDQCVDFQDTVKPIITKCFSLKYVRYFTENNFTISNYFLFNSFKLSLLININNLKKKSAVKYSSDHKKVLDIVRLKLFSRSISEYFLPFSQSVIDTLSNSNYWPQLSGRTTNEYKTIYLTQSLRPITIMATLRSLFGKQIADVFQSKKLEKYFILFDDYFQFASAEIPQMFLYHFSHSKSKLLKIADYLISTYPSTARSPLQHLYKYTYSGGYYNGGNNNEHSIIDQELNDNDDHKAQTIGEILKLELDETVLRNWILTIMWASAANTVPSLFWVFHYLIKNEEYLNATVKEIDEILQGRDVTSLEYEEFLQFGHVKMAIQETFRLIAPPFVVRGVKKDIVTKEGYNIPPGHLICICPFWIHRRESLYQNPEVWDPYRWKSIALSDDPSYQRFVHLAFSAGKYRCPGKSFAYFAIAIVVISVLSKYSIRYPTSNPKFKEPTIDLTHFIGVSKAKEDVLIEVRPRK